VVFVIAHVSGRRTWQLRAPTRDTEGELHASEALSEGRAISFDHELLVGRVEVARKERERRKGRGTLVRDAKACARLSLDILVRHVFLFLGKVEVLVLLVGVRGRVVVHRGVAVGARFVRRGAGESSQGRGHVQGLITCSLCTSQ
jgi:hypothetical protein